MKRTLTLLMGLFMVTGFSAAVMHGGDSLMTADHPLYSAKMAGEEGVEGLAPNETEQVKAKLDHADKRANESKQLADENKTDLANETANEYAKEMQEVNDLGSTISDLAQKQEIDQLVAKATQHHADVLSKVHEKVPEEAQQGLQSALNESVQGYENAVSAMKQRGEDTSGVGNISDSIPSDVQDKAGIDLSDVGPGSKGGGQQNSSYGPNQ